MPMHEARNSKGVWRFRTLDGLVGRLGGTSWRLVHSEQYAPAMREVMILRRDRHDHAAHHVITTVVVPSEAL